jgi:hypothetical protein
VSGVPAGIETGWASMMSATVMPSRRSVKAVDVTAARADCAMNQPITASQRPLKTLPRAARKMPTPITR